MQKWRLSALPKVLCIGSVSLVNGLVPVRFPPRLYSGSANMRVQGRAVYYYASRPATSETFTHGARQRDFMYDGSQHGYAALTDVFRCLRAPSIILSGPDSLLSSQAHVF